MAMARTAARGMGVSGRAGWLFLGASVALHVAVAAAVVVRPVRSDVPVASAPSQTLAGETFELPDTLGAPGVDRPEPEEEPQPAPPSKAAPDTDPSAPAAPPPARPTSRRAHKALAAPASGGATDSPPAPFGAVGDRSAMDLSTAFTRSFPIAASGDAQWARTPFGSSGVADVVFVLDAAGTLKETRIEGTASPALVAGVNRTLALLRNRVFTARGAATRLSVRAVVSPDVAHDGLHGDVFAVGAGFQGREGTAFFALAIGRRVDVHVSERK